MWGSTIVGVVGVVWLRYRGGCGGCCCCQFVGVPLSLCERRGCWTAVRVGLVMLELVAVVAVVVVVLSWWCGVVLFAFGCGGPAVGSLYVCE